MQVGRSPLRCRRRRLHKTAAPCRLCRRRPLSRPTMPARSGTPVGPQIQMVIKVLQGSEFGAELSRHRNCVGPASCSLSALSSPTAEPFHQASSLRHNCKGGQAKTKKFRRCHSVPEQRRTTPVTAASHTEGRCVLPPTAEPTQHASKPNHTCRAVMWKENGAVGGSKVQLAAENAANSRERLELHLLCCSVGGHSRYIQPCKSVYAHQRCVYTGNLHAGNTL